MRNCEECSLCCKLLDVPMLRKPKDVWCKYANKGCVIHKTRPQVCRSFNCLWRQSDVMGENLRPDRCGIVFEVYYPEHTVVAMVEKDKPDAWKNGEPKKLIWQMLNDNYTVWVIIDQDRHLLLPQGQSEVEAMKQAQSAWRRKAA